MQKILMFSRDELKKIAERELGVPLLAFDATFAFSKNILIEIPKGEEGKEARKRIEFALPSATPSDKELYIEHGGEWYEAAPSDIIRLIKLEYPRAQKFHPVYVGGVVMR